MGCLREGDRLLVVAEHGRRSDWLRNALAAPDARVRLWLAGRPYRGRVQVLANADPEDVPLDYYARVLAGQPRRGMVVEGGWPSTSIGSVVTSRGEQSRWIRRQAALLDRERTGQGQFVDVSLFEAAVALEVWETSGYFATGNVPQRLGSAHRVSAPYQAFRAADGPTGGRSIEQVVDFSDLLGAFCGSLGHWRSTHLYFREQRPLART